MAFRVEGKAQGHHVVPSMRCHLVGYGARHLLVVPSAHRHHAGPERHRSCASRQHGRRVVNVGILIPAVIILGCGLLAAIVALITRKKRALWDILPGPVPDPDSEAVPNPPELHVVRADDSPPNDGLEPEMLQQWHRRHEQTVSAWIENHQKVLGEINASGLQVNMGQRDELLAGHEELAPKMREAIASHPSPVMRAELSAMHVAGEATAFAVIKSDYETARRQHVIYVQYRDEWIERLRQFSPSPMTKLRSVMNTDEFELEEIRSALEMALNETEDPEEAEPDFEAPIMVREEPALHQSSAALKAAVGQPSDTTDDLEGGRFRRLLRRLSPPNPPQD